MVAENYPCYVKISDNTSEIVELPTESDGSLLLSTIKSQFPKAIGLRYKSPKTTWRGLNVNNDALFPPPDGWGDVEYFITTGIFLVSSPILNV